MIVRIKFVMMNSEPIYIYSQVDEKDKHKPTKEILRDKIELVAKTCKTCYTRPINGVDPFIILPTFRVDGYDGYDVWINEATDSAKIKKGISINVKYISSITFYIVEC